MLREFAPAKLNLFLHVGARRADNFHELESLAVFADVADELEFAAATDLSLTINGPFAANLQTEPDNLVLRAARTLAAHAKIPPNAKITLTKNLPVASGIGGGSADAAATLRGLAKLWNLDLPQQTMQEIALSLGSDVPICLLSKPAWMAGRGEEITPIPLPNISMVLVNPGVAISTAQAFTNLKTRTGICAPKPGLIRTATELCTYLKNTTNDLETPAREIAPIISEALIALTASGAMLTRMSGSGATCFGIFEDDVAAEEAVIKIANANPNWWVKCTKSLPSP